MSAEGDLSRERSINPKWREAIDYGLDMAFEMYEELGAPIVTSLTH